MGGRRVAKEHHRRRRRGPGGLDRPPHWRVVRGALDGGTFEVLAPAFEDRLATSTAAQAADVDAAVVAARAQLESGDWSRLTPADGGRLLYRLAARVERDLEIFATLEALGEDCNDHTLVASRGAAPGHGDTAQRKAGDD